MFWLKVFRSCIKTFLDSIYCTSVAEAFSELWIPCASFCGRWENINFQHFRAHLINKHSLLYCNQLAMIWYLLLLNFHKRWSLISLMGLSSWSFHVTVLSAWLFQCIFLFLVVQLESVSVTNLPFLKAVYVRQRLVRDKFLYLTTFNSWWGNEVKNISPYHLSFIWHVLCY